MDENVFRVAVTTGGTKDGRDNDRRNDDLETLPSSTIELLFPSGVMKPNFL